MRHPHLFSSGAQADPAFPVKPMSTGFHPRTFPAVVIVILVDQDQQAIGGCMDMGGELRNLIFQRADVFVGMRSKTRRDFHVEAIVINTE